jgi:hypothetical protein
VSLTRPETAIKLLNIVRSNDVLYPQSFNFYLSLAAERTLKGIADNLSELINEASHF